MPTKDAGPSPQKQLQPAVPPPISDFANRVRTLGIKQLEDVHDSCHIPDELVEWAHSLGLHVSLQAITMVEEGKLSDFAMMPLFINELPQDQSKSLLDDLHFYGYRERPDKSIAKGDCLLCVQGAEVRSHRIAQAKAMFDSQDQPAAVQSLANQISDGIDKKVGQVIVTDACSLREFYGAPKGEVYG